MTDDTDLQPVVAAEFLALADLLGSATQAQWDTPSLCAGWRVREVIAHMTMAARYPEDKFMAELRLCEFDFGRLSNEIASRDAGHPTTPPGSSSMTSPRAACTSTSAPASKGAACRLPTLTGHTVQARRCTARPRTWRSCSAAGRSQPGGSKGSRCRRRRG